VQRIPDRQVLESADKRRRYPLWIASQLNRFQPRYQLGEETADFHAGQRRPQTEVHTVSEGQMLVGVAADVETEWSKRFRNVRVGLLALTQRLSGLLPHLSRADLALIDSEVRQVLSDVADGKFD